MESTIWSIVLIDDDEEEYFLTRQMLSITQRGKYALDWCSNYEEGRQALISGKYDAALVDYHLGHASGLELIREVIQAGCRTPILMLTGHGSYELDVEAMQSGAMDYLMKAELTSSSLERAIRYAMERSRSEQIMLKVNEELSQARKEAERVAALARASATQFEAVINNVIDAVLVFDCNAKVILANSFAVDLLGFDPQKMCAGEMFSRLDLRDEAGHPIPMDGVPSLKLGIGEFERNYPMTVTNVAGQHFSVLASTMPLFIGKEYMGVVTVWNDVTAMKQAHEELEAERTRLEAVLRSLPVGVLIADQNGAILSKNSEMDAIWSDGDLSTAKAALDEQYAVWKPGSNSPDPPEQHPFVLALKEGKHLKGIEYDIRREDGTVGSILVSTAPIQDVEGRRLGAVAVTQDITIHKAAEHALKLSEERFRLALLNVPLTVFTMDRDLRFTWVYNPRSGFGEADLLGRRLNEIAPQENVQEILSILSAVLETGEPQRAETSGLLPGGQAFFIQAFEPLRDARGAITGLVGAVLNITEQRRLEAQHNEARVSAEMRQHLLDQREVERQLIAREIHDGPIQSVISLLFALQIAINTSTEPALVNSLHEISSGMQKLVSELRELCNELRPPSLAQFGLAQAIRSHANSWMEKSSQLKILLRLVEDNQLLPDATRLALFRIFQEGLNNIQRHSRATQVVVSLAFQNGQVTLSIEDNGAGFHFSGDWLELVQQGHLGLVGMKERAEALGGTIEVSTQEGRGTRLTISIPIKANDALPD